MEDIRYTESAFEPISALVLADDISSRKYKKEIVAIGEYVNDKRPISITSSALDNWVAQFAVMKKNGVKVPIVSTHEGDGDPDKNRGWMLDLFRERDSLFMVCELIGEDAILAASRSDVSLRSDPNYRDGKGNAYTHVITHVALCTHPVIPGLSDFIPLAASLRLKEKDMDIKRIGEAISLELVAATAEQQLIDHCLELSKTTNDAKEKSDALTKQVDQLKAASQKPEPLSGITLELAMDNRKLKLDSLLGTKISPAVHKQLMSIFATKETLELALAPQGYDVFAGVMAALAENDIVKLKEQTGAQLLDLEKKDGDGKNEFAEALVADAEQQAKDAVAV